MRSIIAFLICFILPLQAAVSPEIVKKRMFSDLNFIRNCFEVRYAPVDWKKKFANWDLESEIFRAKTRVDNLSNPTLKDYRYIVRDLFASAWDHHVSVHFHSTEEASLPFLVKCAEKRYFVVAVDRTKLPLTSFPFRVGDEILTFGGAPIHNVVNDLRMMELGMNTGDTNQDLAAFLLTNRRMCDGHFVPSGTVAITGRDRNTKEVRKAVLKWNYTPESIRDFAHLGRPFQTGVGFDKKKIRDDFKMMMVASPACTDAPAAGKYGVGSRESYIPSLGSKVWESEKNSSFHAYIFSSPSGALIGYIRIPHYMHGTDTAEDFGEIISLFQSSTDALVIDQINNPGGSLFHAYALASMLTDYPLETPKHYMTLTQAEIQYFLDVLDRLDSINLKDPLDQEWFRFAESLDGYHVDAEFIESAKEFCKFAIDQWNHGKLYTDPVCLFGTRFVKPNPKHVYKKPILLITNSLVFSGGDFFAAIMQDGGRAKIFGEQTAGAGGFVLPTEFPNQTGIRYFNLTASLAERVNREPLENLGVRPDIPYALTADDLQYNYRNYVAKILEAVENLLRS